MVRLYCACVIVDEAAAWSHAAIMNNHGQNCCAGSRTFVHEAIYDKFVEHCKAAAEKRVVGDPWDDLTQQGPQVSHYIIRVVDQ